jgi:hypothetical protein
VFFLRVTHLFSLPRGFFGVVGCVWLLVECCIVDASIFRLLSIFVLSIFCAECCVV